MIAEASKVTEASKSVGANADWFGVFCSVACAVHCAATPILLSLLPSVSSVRWLADPLFHQVVAVLCVGMVVMAILPGVKVHRDWRVGVFAGAGIFLLLSAAFVLPDTCCEHADETQMASSLTTNNAMHAHAKTDRHAHEHLHLNSNALLKEKSTLTKSLVSTRTGSVCECTSEVCQARQPIGQTLISTADLQAGFGGSLFQSLASSQPYLSPLGGVLLIIAHLLNIRLRCCGQAACPLRTRAEINVKISGTNVGTEL